MVGLRIETDKICHEMSWVLILLVSEFYGLCYQERNQDMTDRFEILSFNLFRFVVKIVWNILSKEICIH